jgi:hypothetical protein
MENEWDVLGNDQEQDVRDNTKDWADDEIINTLIGKNLKNIIWISSLATNAALRKFEIEFAAQRNENYHLAKKHLGIMSQYEKRISANPHLRLVVPKNVCVELANISDYSIVLFPLFDADHWSLLSFNSRSSEDIFEVVHYDSILKHHENIRKRVLKMLYSSQIITAENVNTVTIDYRATQQRGEWECAYYVLLNAKIISEENCYLTSTRITNLDVVKTCEDLKSVVLEYKKLISEAQK